MKSREGCIALNLVSGIGFVKYSALVERFGSPEQVFAASREELLEVPGIGEQLAERIASFDQAQLDRELEIAERGGARILTLYDEDYPEILRQLFDPPLAIYLRGRLKGSMEAWERSVAIVGTRRVSAYGMRMTSAIADEAAAAGFTIVSGLALGVDTLAHQAAVSAGTPTIAVLGGGLLHLHPRENLELARGIIDSGGAIISEFPLDFPVNRTTFPRRNRIVAALSRGVIVTEAGEKSGAIITAKLALEQGREVFAVPGHADNPQAHGCHELIRQGATLIETFEQVLEAFGFGMLPHLGDGAENARPPEEEVGSDLSALEVAIMNRLAKGDASLEDLQTELATGTSLLLSALMRLELKLLIERQSDRSYRRIPLRGEGEEGEGEG